MHKTFRLARRPFFYASSFSVSSSFLTIDTSYTLPGGNKLVHYSTIPKPQLLSTAQHTDRGVPI